jgi:hypothetical protein
MPAERIHVCILGHTGLILGSYLRDIFQSRHSSFVAMTQLENHISQPCLTDPTHKIFGLFNLDDKNLPPDGSNAASRILFVFFVQNIIGCAPSAPDGSSHRGYSRKNIFSSIVSKDNVPSFML